MKSSTLVILCAALAFGVPGNANAQNTTVGATVGATVDATAGATGVGANVDANGSAAVGTDANGADGNGTDAAAAGGTDANTGIGDSMKCEELGSAASIESMGKMDMMALGAATKVSIVPVAGCDDTTRSALASAGGTDLRDALIGNASVNDAVKARGATMADVLGATVSGDTITVYVESEDVAG